jgi:hypothetical protein
MSLAQRPRFGLFTATEVGAPPETTFETNNSERRIDQATTSSNSTASFGLTTPYSHILMESTIPSQMINRARIARNLPRTSIPLILLLPKRLVYHFRLANKNNGAAGIAAKCGLEVMKSTISHYICWKSQ